MEEEAASKADMDCESYGYDSCGAMDLSSCASSSKAPDDTDEDEDEEEEEMNSSSNGGGHVGHGRIARLKRKAEHGHGATKRKKKECDDTDSNGCAPPGLPNNTLPLKVRNKRRNIKGVMEDGQLDVDTKTAKTEEQERLSRLADQQKQIFMNARSSIVKHEISSSDDDGKFKDSLAITATDSDDLRVVSCEEDEEGDEEDPNNSGMHVNDELNVPDSTGRVLVNVGHPGIDEDVFLAPQLAECVKPHQIGGIRFLYDNIVESQSRYANSTGFGCILAHSMGLGKTIQVVSFVDVLLQTTSAQKVLCIVPINTIQNWLAEFNYWLPAKGEYSKLQDKCRVMKPRSFQIHVLNDSLKNLGQRAGVIGAWDRSGGVLLMGYELYRQLANKKPRKKKGKGMEQQQQLDNEEEDRNKNMLNDIQTALVDPGPDLVICDEGHRIKNSHASISQALKQIKTRRRVVLTGYPLQNNLMEYWCMVDFVRPNYLGNKTEFSNMFERPIQNGQCIDSTSKDVRLMKHRAHVLHEQLKGFVQRRGHQVLKESLPPKTEHVLFVRLTEVQRRLYKRFMEELISNRCVSNPLKAFAVCCKIWNHPDVLYNFLKKKEEVDIDFDPEEVIGFRAGGKMAVGGGGGGSVNGAGKLPETEFEMFNDGKKEEINYDWAQGMLAGYVPDNEKNSNKLQIFLGILEESLAVDDRLLLFSQSLCTLNLLEDFLQKRTLPGTQERWRLGVNYFRLDGSTSALERERLINTFNADTGVKLFLVSTRAGSLGVNLVGANRVVIYDASWNPCHDTQAVCRVYRYGQTKNSHVYRLVTDNSLEKKIYDRQINKQGMADRVVDELNPDAHLSSKEVHSLICDEEDDPPEIPVGEEDVQAYKDPVMRKLVLKFGTMLTKHPFAHESLLIDRKDQKLSKAEKRIAERAYKLERTSKITYSRPSYAAFYPKKGTFATNLHNPGASGYIRNRYFENGKKLDTWVSPYNTNRSHSASESNSSLENERPSPAARGAGHEPRAVGRNLQSATAPPGGSAPPFCYNYPESEFVETAFPTPMFSNVLNPPPYSSRYDPSEDWKRPGGDSSGSSSESSGMENVRRNSYARHNVNNSYCSASSTPSSSGGDGTPSTTNHHEKFDALAVLTKRGLGLEQVEVSRDLTIPPTNSSDSPICLKAGQRVTVIRTPKGIYLRMGDKIIKIKQPGAVQGLLGNVNAKDSSSSTDDCGDSSSR